MTQLRVTPNFQKLKRYISEGTLEMVFSDLFPYLEGVDTHMTTDLYLASARFRQLRTEKIRGSVSMADYNTEFNSITLSLLEIINYLSELSPNHFKQVQSKGKLKNEIEELALEFDRASQMKSTLAGMRMQVHIARKIAEKLILWPDLIKEYRETSNLAILCAIGRKVKMVPDIEDLSILESLTPHATSDFAKQFITNALAELIYSGQLRIGDDVRLREVLQELGKDAGILLSTNVKRVEALVDFITGQI